MAKLKLNPDPTFTAPVRIPVPGGEADPVQLTFKHRTREQVADFLRDKDTSDSDAVLNCVVGWDLADEFNAENVGRLCNNYPGAAGAIVIAYLEELRGARAKN